MKLKSVVCEIVRGKEEEKKEEEKVDEKRKRIVERMGLRVARRMIREINFS